MALLKNVSLVLLFLLPIAFMTSMAAMETLSWSFFALFLVHLGFDIQQKSASEAVSQLKLNIDWAVWGYFLIVLVGAIFLVEKKQIDVIGDARWVLLLYSYSYVLKKYLTINCKKYSLVLAAVVSIVGLLSLLQFTLGWDITRSRNILVAFDTFYRASGFFNHPLTFAYSIGIVWLIFLSLFLNEFARARLNQFTIIWGLATVFSTIGLITSLSRGAWLAGIVGFLIVVSKVGKKWTLAMIALMLVLATTLSLSNQTFQNRVKSLTTISENESNRLRTVLWRANWEIFKDHPIIGVGLSKNRNYLMQYYEKMNVSGNVIESHAHNNYLQILAGTGVIGFFFYVSFSLYFLILAWRLYQKLNDSEKFYSDLALGLFAAQVFFHIGGLTQCNFTDGEVNHLLIFIWSLQAYLNFRFSDSIVGLRVSVDSKQ